MSDYTPVCVLCLVERQGDGEHALVVKRVAADRPGRFRVLVPVCARHMKAEPLHAASVFTTTANEAQWIGPVAKPEETKGRART